MIRVKRKRETRVPIPTASMSDIAFLLLIFFMVATVFRRGTGLKIALPEARTTQKLGRQRDLAYLWITKNGKMSLDDNFVDPGRLALLMRTRVAETPGVITVIKADKDAPYEYVDKAINSLREAEALRVVFAARYKGGP